jgi:hypothetical protein
LKRPEVETRVRRLQVLQRRVQLRLPRVGGGGDGGQRFQS